MGGLSAIIGRRIAGKLGPNVICNVICESFDYGSQLGAAVQLPDGTRHAVRVRVENDDLTAAADLAAEGIADWLANR
jgi:hypothetical protein